LLKKAGVDVHVQRLREEPGRGKRVKKASDVSKSATSKSIRDRPPTVVIDETLTADEVKRHTGFADIFFLLSFVALVCNGNVDAISTTVSSLSWLEEWMLYFEFTWGQTVMRHCDAAAIYGLGSTSRPTVVRILAAKRVQVLLAREAWPRFCSFEEDKKLRDEKWNQRYGDLRVIFWDNTNENIPKPSGGNENSATYSAYYGGNVGKGGVFLQLCGWLGSHDLWTGAASDSFYLGNSGILELQEEFAALDLVNGCIIPFTNVTDKGYRCVAAAWRRGGQFILQPQFAKSDQ